MGSTLSHWIYPKSPFPTLCLLVHLLISINRLLESVLLCPKVIPLSDAHCILYSTNNIVYTVSQIKNFLFKYSRSFKDLGHQNKAMPFWVGVCLIYAYHIIIRTQITLYIILHIFCHNYFYFHYEAGVPHICDGWA